MRIISNAILYTVESANTSIDPDLQALAFEPITPGVYGSVGFIANKKTGELLSSFEGGFYCTLRSDQKILPATAVKAAVRKELDEAIKQAEEKGEDFSEEQQHMLEANVRSKLVANALVRTSLTSAIYSQKSGVLIVLTSSQPKADLMINRLVATLPEGTMVGALNMGAVPEQLTERLKLHVRGAEDAFAGLSLGNYAILNGIAGRASFDLDDLQAASTGLDEVLRTGMTVSRLALAHGTMRFRLNQDGHLSAIRFDGELTEDELLSRKDMDQAHLWRTEAAAQLLELDSAVAALRQIFTVEDAAQPPQD